MGFRIACAAISKADIGTALPRLGLELTPQEDGANEAPYSGGDVDNDYFLIWKNTSDIAFNKKENAVLNGLQDCIVMAVSESVMSGFVRKITGGKVDWEITYIGCEAEIEFNTEGNVPPHIISLYESLDTQGEDENVDDTYEILSLTFKHFTGHKYYEVPKFKFYELRSHAASKPWWKFW